MEEEDNTARTVDALDALAQAATLYERYVQLAKLAEIPIEFGEPPVTYEHSWDHPLGLKLTS